MTVSGSPFGSIKAFYEGLLHEGAFLRCYPYYAAVLAELEPVGDPSVHRMAVSNHQGRFFLHVNIDAFVEEPTYLRGVLLHEVHHIVLGHLSHDKFARCDYPELMTLALEMSANEYISEPLPNPILWKEYVAIGVRAHQSTLERYDLLVKATRSRPAPGVSAERPPKLDGEPVDDHTFLAPSATDGGGLDPTRRALARALDTDLPEPSDGDPPQARLLAGKDPGRLLEELLGVGGPAEHFIDYKTALRVFVAFARAPVHTYARPSRRFPGAVGRVPGRMYSPRQIDRPSLVVAIDTSASMLGDELSEIARQLAALAEFARITVAECDTEITRVYPFDGLIPSVVGRGGTDLRPVFDPGFLRAHGADGVVYFTDGLGPFPDAAPAVQVLWVLTKPLEFLCPWGQRALVPTRTRLCAPR